MLYYMLLLCLVVLALTAVSAQAEPVNIGSRLELFVDDYLIESLDQVELQLQHPIEKESVLIPDAPWEGETSAYFTVFQDGSRYRMYYRGSNYSIDPHELTCTAESEDGIRWTKPELGLYDFKGSKKNNIVLVGNATHAFVPFKDANPSAKPDEQYKAVALIGFEGKPALFAYISPDGYNWKSLQDKPIQTEGAFDSQNLVFWDSEKGEYECYFRDFRDGLREIKHSSSKDFIHWSKPEWLNMTGAPRFQLYTNAVQPYFRAPYLYMGFPKRFFEERKLISSYPETGISDGGYMTSRDGVNFHIWPEAFVRPGLDQDNWTDRSTMAAWGMLQLKPEEISMYYSRDYQHPTTHIARMTIRTDGFVSAHAGGTTGNLITKPLLFEGKNLVINFSSSAGSGIRVELLDENNIPIPGFELASCPFIYGDKIEHIVSWKSGSDLSALANKPVRIRFQLTDADIYSFRFKP